VSADTVCDRDVASHVILSSSLFFVIDSSVAHRRTQVCNANCQYLRYLNIPSSLPPFDCRSRSHLSPLFLLLLLSPSLPLLPYSLCSSLFLFQAGDGRDVSCPVITVYSGNEPRMFTCHFKVSAVICRAVDASEATFSNFLSVDVVSRQRRVEKRRCLFQLSLQSLRVLVLCLCSLFLSVCPSVFCNWW
jgi:hypothetical protein